MSASLRLSREGSLGFELRRGTFHIEVDGADVGSIDWHETKEVPIEPGHHTLRLRTGRYRSLVRSFDVRDGSVASFRCHAAMLWPRWVASALMPELGIALARD